MHSLLESCEELRFLGFRLIQMIGRVGSTNETSELDFLQQKITEHRQNCPNCIASDRRRHFCVLWGGGIQQQRDAEDFFRTDTHDMNV